MAKRGARVGNKNAEKHGFYSEILTEKEKMVLEKAGEINGLDAELAILRLKFRNLLKKNPDRIDLQLQALGMIARLVRTRYVLSPSEREQFKDAIGNVLEEVAIPLGLKSII